MKLVIFGLTISSSWGNGHATLLRGLFRAFIRRGHQVVFFEHDVPYYAENRDLSSFDDIRLHLYQDWNQVIPLAEAELRDADVGMVTSYCLDGVAASELIFNSPAQLRIFYDLDTPVTLARMEAGESLTYIGPRGLRDFDLALSYTGGAALEELQMRLHAPRVAPLYGSVDPEVHSRVAPMPQYRGVLSYIGTYAEDRQAILEELFVNPARRLPAKTFVIAGARYPSAFPWAANIFFVQHLPPQEHAAFFSSSRLTLNVTRSSMARMGYCPSGRLFEAAACGVPILSDGWPGLEDFFTPGSEILIASCAEDAIGAICLGDAELSGIARAAREHVLDCHTAEHRAAELERILGSGWSRRPLSAPSESIPDVRAET